MSYIREHIVLSWLFVVWGLVVFHRISCSWVCHILESTWGNCADKSSFIWHTTHSWCTRKIQRNSHFKTLFSKMHIFLLMIYISEGKLKSLLCCSTTLCDTELVTYTVNRLRWEPHFSTIFHIFFIFFVLFRVTPLGVWGHLWETLEGHLFHFGINCKLCLRCFNVHSTWRLQ